MSNRMIPTLFVLVLSAAASCWGQESRGSITGKVTDTERLNTNFSVDFLNATNHTNFSDPDTNPISKTFGMVTSQRGVSRVLHFNLRIDL